MEFHLLGPVELGLHGQRLELGSDKERCLLAALALDVGRPVSLDALVDRLWGDDTPPLRARANIHTYVSRLRGRLRLATDPGTDAPRIDSRAHTYTLLADPETVDWHRFQRMVSFAATCGEDDARVADILTRADELWSGEHALSGLPGAWPETVRRALAAKRLSATVSRIHAGLRLGRFADLVGELSALVDQHPADEGLVGQLMLAHYGCGRYTDALRVHQQARQLLMAEYGSRPGAELNRIHRGILDRAPAHDLVRGTVPSASARPAPAPVAAPPPAGPSSLPPRNLPHQPPLVGRQAELRALEAAVGTGAAEGQVVTLSTVNGMAGVGKTAVAVDIARRLAPHFPAGQLYIDLRGHSPAEEPLPAAAALAMLLRLLGTPAEMLPVEPAARTALWRTAMAERRAIIVLDDAAGPEQVRPLLPGGSPSLTIITSRRHLTGLPHAHTVPLDVLPPGDAIALFRRFAGEERTQDVKETARVVRLCGYLPLAIELVAGRFRARPAWTLTTLTERLTRSEGRLSEIREGDGHEIWRAFDLSHRTLTDPQRGAFRRLALHPGSDFTADAAAALLGLPPDDTERLLESLLACHLLREPAPDRYRYHDLLKEFARSLALTEDDEDTRAQAVGRLTDFYIAATDRADRLAHPRRIRLDLLPGAPAPHLPSWPDAEGARSWFTTEHGNLLSVEHHARANGAPDQAARLAHVLAGFLDADCHWGDASAVHQHAVEHWSRTTDDRALCHALLYLSTAHTSTGRYPEADATGRRALSLAQATGDQEAEAEALRVLGVVNWHLGEYRSALVLFQKRFAIKSVFEDFSNRARSHDNLAMALMSLGEHKRALRHCQMAVAAFREAQDSRHLGKALSNLGDLYAHMGDLEQARRCLEESLPLLDTSGNRYEQATARTNLADILAASGDSDTAIPLYRNALLAFRALGDRKSVGNALNGVGQAHQKAGRFTDAVECHLQAYQIARDIGTAREEMHALCCLGQAELALGHLEAAADHLTTAISTAHRTQDQHEESVARELLSKVHLTRGHTQP